MSKNIVVLSDGTGQEGGRGHDTNVYKLFRMLEDRTDKQVVFYDEGLGTDWRKFTGNAFGSGFSKNLLQCYQFIYDNYNAGDKIFLFGFSRGAATVRSLASFIHYFGILPKSRPELIKKAFKLYRRGREKVSSEVFKKTYNILSRGKGTGVENVLNKKAMNFVHEHPNQWAQIEFLGVWDTVPALGLVALAGLNSYLGKLFRYSFHDFKLHPSVRNAYHAVSIDDDRLWFQPSLWTEKTREEQIVEQVWFSGAHTDIGGGFLEPGLSDISLEWVIEKAVSHGLRIYLGSRQYWNFVVAPDATDRYHPPRTGFGRIFIKGVRNNVWEDQGADVEFGMPILHRTVLERHKRRVQGDEPEPEDDRNPWILKKASKSSNFFEEKDFIDFLRQKFYEYLKYEWKKYDWDKKQHQEKEFDAWIQASKYKEYYDSYDWEYRKVYKEDKYKEYCITCWKEGIASENRREWMKTHPYTNEKGLDPEWLERYQPYIDWFEEHTEKHDKQTYYVEPARLVNDFAKTPKHLRDYDEESLGGILAGDDPNPDNLQGRGYNEDKDHNRIEYDRKRWGGSDNSYNENFLTKLI